MRKKLVLVVTLLLIIPLFIFFVISKGSKEVLNVDLTNLKFNNESIKVYTEDDYEKFLIDYNNNKLPKIYAIIHITLP